MSRNCLNFLEIPLLVFLYFLSLCTISCEPVTNIIVGGSHGGVAEVSRLVWSYSVPVGKQFSTFIRTVITSSSGIKQSLTSTYSPSRRNIPKGLNFKVTIVSTSCTCQIRFTTCKINLQLHGMIDVHFRVLRFACENNNFKRAENLL